MFSGREEKRFHSEETFRLVSSSQLSSETVFSSSLRAKRKKKKKIAKEVLFERPEGTDGVLNWTWFTIHYENKASLSSEGTGHF